MNVLFIHQDMPGQFGRLAGYLASLPHHRVMFLGKRAGELPGGVTCVRYQPPVTRHSDPFLSTFETAVLHGRAVAQACRDLRDQGFVPDVIVAHPGWGESLFVKDVLPHSKLINYCEFYYRAEGADVGFDPDDIVDDTAAALLRSKNAHLLLSLEACDRGLSATQWQRRLHPAAYQDKIDVVFDGVEADTVRPNPAAMVHLPDGTKLSRRDTVVTFVARDLEPHRGFPQFMRALPDILGALPQAHIVIAGGDGVSYGRKPQDGRTWRAVMCEEIRLSSSRVHFTGTLPYDTYLSLLQVSTAHVYLTVPFVLSWSFVESLSAGCLVVASDTPPVREFLRDGDNGLLCDMLDPTDIARKVIGAIRHHADLEALRRRARQTVLGRLDCATCLPQQHRLLLQVAGDEFGLERCA